MAANPLALVLRQLRKLSDGEDSDQLQDRLLLERFVTGQDEAAFAALLARHGPMVLDVCRRVLREPHSVDDAFQATFLVLARKASSIRKSDLLANWLYGVAYRTASRARVEAAKRQARERLAPVRSAADPLDTLTVRELFTVLDEELNRLPTQYRGPLVLCYLESRTRGEAARQAGCSRATLERRLQRGREMLKVRLARRGMTLGLALGPALLSEATAATGLAPSLVTTTLKAATAAASRGGAASVIAPPIVALMEGVLRTMFLTKLKVATVVLLVLVLVTASVSGLMFGVAASADPAQLPEAQEVAMAKEGKQQQPNKKSPMPNAGKPKPASDIAVIVKADLYEVDDAFYKKVAKAKFLSMEDLEKLEREFLDLLPAKVIPPAPPAGESLFQLLDKQKLILAGKEVKMDNGQEATVLSWHKIIQCLPGPDQVRKGEKAPQKIQEGVSFRAGVQASSDRRFVRVKITEKSAAIEAIEKVKVLLHNTDKEVMAEVPFLKEAAHSQLRYIPDGGSLLLPVHYRPQAATEKNRWLVLSVTPRIYIEEEEKAIQKGLLAPVPTTFFSMYTNQA